MQKFEISIHMFGLKGTIKGAISHNSLRNVSKQDFVDVMSSGVSHLLEEFYDDLLSKEDLH